MEVPGIKSPWINWVINLMAGLVVRVERRHGGKPGEVETEVGGMQPHTPGNWSLPRS